MKTKDYLRFKPGNVFGLVASSNAKIANVHNKKENHYLFAVPACEDVYIWNMQSKEKIGELKGEKSSVTCFVVDNGCRNIAVGYSDGMIRIFDLKDKDRKYIVSFIGHKSPVSCLTYEDRGSNLASGGKDSEIVLWNILNQTGLFRLKGHKGPISKCVFFQPKNVLITSSFDTYIKLWDLDTKHCFHTIVGLRNEILDFTLVKETNLIIGTNNLNLEVWKIVLDEDEDECSSESKKLRLNSFIIDAAMSSLNSNETEDEINYLKVEKVGAIMTAESKTSSISVDSTQRLIGVHGSTKVIQLYKVLTTAEINKKLRKRKAKEMKRKKKEGEDIDSESTVTLSVDDEYVSLGTFQLLGKVDSYTITVNDQDLARITVLFKNNSIGQYCMDLRKEIPQLELSRSIMLPGHRSFVKTLSYSTDSLSILSASNESVKIWKSVTEDYQCANTLESNQALCSLFVTGNNHCVIGTKKGMLIIYDINAEEILEEIAAHSGSVLCVASSPEETGITSGGSDKEVKFWDFELITDEKYLENKKRLSLTLRRNLKMPDEILCLQYSPDHKKIAIALLDSTVQVLFVDTLKLAFSLYGHALPVTCMDISHDSSLIVTGSEDKDVRIWSLEFGSCNRFLKKAHDKGITCLCFEPKTHHFFTGSRDNTIKQWDADNFQKIITLQGHQNEITAMAVSPNGYNVVTASKDKSIRMWHKTDEILVLQEEQEEEEKEMLETTEDLPTIPGEVNKEVALSGMKTEETIKTVDELIEALKLYSSEVLKFEDYKNAGKKVPESEKNKIFQYFKVSTPLEYMKYVLTKKVKPKELEGVLLYLPFNYVLDFLRILSEFANKGWETELCEKCATFLVKLHFGQILSAQNFEPVIENLKQKLFNRVYQMRDKIGYAKTVSHLQQMAIDAREQVSMFSDILENVQKKKKKSKRKLERPILAFT